MEDKELICKIFSEFMAKVVKVEELANSGSRLLLGFRQGLEFIRRPPIDMTSNSMEQFFRANATKRMLAYIEAGCVKTQDKIENVSNLHTSQLGLYDHLSKAKHIVDELESLCQKVASEMVNLNKIEPSFEDKVAQVESEAEDSTNDKADNEILAFQKPGVTDYAVMMGIIYSMVKQDFDMQEKIITSLTIKSTSGELESYSWMWSLRPYINDEIMHQALRLIP